VRWCVSCTGDTGVSLYVVTDADGSLTAYLRQLIETIPPPQKRHGEKDDRSISLINISFSKWAECTQVMLNNLNKNIIVPSLAWVRTHTFLQKIQNSMSMNSMNSITYEPLYKQNTGLGQKAVRSRHTHRDSEIKEHISVFDLFILFHLSPHHPWSNAAPRKNTLLINKGSIIQLTLLLFWTLNTQVWLNNEYLSVSGLFHTLYRGMFQRKRAYGIKACQGH